MEFKYALSILFSNMGYAFKILLWVLISLIITAAIGVAILYPIFDVIVKTTDVASFVNGIGQSISTLLDGGISIKTMVSEVAANVAGAFDAIASNTGATVGLVFACIFVYAVYCFLVGLSYYPVADIINKYMASNLRFGFASNMALNFKNACRYSAARLVVSLPVDILFVVIMTSMTLGLVSVIKIFALPIVLIFALLFCTLRAMLFAGWLPRMLHHPEERVFTNFTRSFTFVKSNKGGFFKAYLITFTCVYLLASVFSLPTGGLISLILPSMYYMLLRTVELIGYYKAKGYRFYTDANTVINTVEFGYRNTELQYGAETVDNDGFDVEKHSVSSVSDGAEAIDVAPADPDEAGKDGAEAIDTAETINVAPADTETEEDVDAEQE